MNSKKAVNTPPLASGDIGQSIRSLMIPMLIGMTALISYNIVDTFFIGQLGTLELAAISFTFPISFLVGAVVMGFGIGTSSVCSRLFGANAKEEVERVAVHAILLGLVTSGLVIGLGLWTIEPVFRMLGADDTTMPIIERYMRIYYWGGIFLVVPMISNSVLRASGNAKSPAIIMSTAAMLNIVLDPILIFGWFGLPRLEVEGAAIATLIANAVTLVASLSVIVFRDKLISFRALWPALIIDSWRRILHVGLPSMASSIVAPLTTAFITYQIAQFGAETVAGFGVASRIEGLSLLPLMALSAAMAPFIGQNFGARRFDRIKAGVKWSYNFCLIYGIGVAIVIAVSSGFIAGIFSDDPVAISTTQLHMWIVPASYFALGMSMVVNNAFNAIGKPIPGMYVSLTRTLLVYAPLAFILANRWGVIGVFAAACIANFISGITGVIWLNKTAKAIENKIKAMKSATQTTQAG